VIQIIAVGGEVMGFSGYRCSDQTKTLDLRLELRTALGDVDDPLSTLRAVMNAAAGFRRAALATKRLGGSGAMERGIQMADGDLAEVDKIVAFVPSAPSDRELVFAEMIDKGTHMNN
jgi:hypothetical protein